MAIRDRDFLDLRQRLLQVQQQVYQRPLMVSSVGGGGGASEETWVQVVNGNTLTGGLTGLKKIAIQLPAQAVWIDPYAVTVLADGLGRANIWRNGVQGLVKDATVWKVSTAYGIGNKVRGSNAQEAFICTVAGTSAAVKPGPTGTGTGIIDNTVTWDYDPTVPFVAERTLIVLDTRAQWNFAIAATEWSRIFSAVVIGNAVNPSTGLAEDMYAYPLAYM